jgi:hypothetical protein
MSTLTAEHQSFVAQSEAINSNAKAAIAGLAPNTCQVWPGGAIFNSIQAAMNSITGASPQEQYQIAVGSGTFNENVVMKDYVYIIGAGQDVTIITAPAQSGPQNGVINSASGGGISDVTINAPGAGWGSWPIGINICGSGSFHIKGVTINTGSGSNGDNVRAITNNAGSHIGNVIIGQCIFNITGDNQSTCTGLELFGTQGVNPSLVVYIDLTTIQATAGGQNFGVTTAIGANVSLQDSKIVASTYALYNSDGGSLITANSCTIGGPVSGGVVVNN